MGDLLTRNNGTGPHDGPDRSAIRLQSPTHVTYDDQTTGFPIFDRLSHHLDTAIAQKLASMMPHERDIAPTHPRERLGWCLTQIVTLAPQLGLDERALMSLLDWHYIVEHPDEDHPAVNAFLVADYHSRNGANS